MIFKAIVHTVEGVVFILLLAIFFMVLSPLLPTKKYIYTYIVATGSMEPTIHAGSVALVQPIQPVFVKKGDIITFTSPKDGQTLIIHRVTAIKNQGRTFRFKTKGDNNNNEDNWLVYGSLVKGRMAAAIPYLGHLATFIKTPKGFLMMIIIPAIILVLFQVKTIKEGIEEEVERRTKSAREKAKKHPLTDAIILATILNGFVFYGANNYVKALLTSTASVSGISISVKDFVPPLPTDTIKPESVITTGLNLCDDNNALKLHLHLTKRIDWDGKIEGIASDSGGSGLKEIQLSIYRPLVDRYWNGDWVNGSETTTRVTAVGQENWYYQLPSHPTGIYVITSHAVDNADNTENSFVLILDSETSALTPIPATPAVNISLAADRKTASFTATGIEGYLSLSYELTYHAYDTARGIRGSGVDITGLTQYSKTDLDLASCSDNVCTYDTDINQIAITVTLLRADGSSLQMQQNL